MKKPRFKESQIFQVLKEAEAGVPVPEPIGDMPPAEYEAMYYQERAGGNGRLTQAQYPPEIPGGFTSVLPETSG